MRVLAATALCAALIAGTPAAAHGKPSRSECMVGYHLDWSDVQQERGDVANAIAAANRSVREETLAGLMFQAHHSELYLIFRERCEYKATKAAALFDGWRREGVELPIFARIPDPISPSLKTIDIQGPYWRDGEPDGIPPSQFLDNPNNQDL